MSRYRMIRGEEYERCGAFYTREEAVSTRKKYSAKGVRAATLKTSPGVWSVYVNCKDMEA